MKFFTSNLSKTSIDNENDFKFMRGYLLNKPTITEHQTAARIAETDDSAEKDIVENPIVKARLGPNSKLINNLIVHCTYENRLETYKKEIHQLWNRTFNETPVMNTINIVGNRHNRNMTQELVRHRPHITSPVRGVPKWQKLGGGR
jgi:hypothetical protein